MDPLISILIPTYNRAHLIGDTLNSIKAQHYKNWECIIVDDGSTDETDKILADFCRRDCRFHYFHRPSNKPKGANACRNYGFKISKGEYIQLLDSDDILEIDCLSERIECISKDKSIDILIRDTGLLMDSVKKYDSINLDPDEKTNENYLRMFLRYDIPWHTSSTLYKRELFAKCKFDESLGRFQDVSFNIKILSTCNDLKFLRDYKIDSFYRVENNKRLTKEYLKLLITSLKNFNKIHAGLLINPLYKSDLRIFNIKFFNGYFLNNIKNIKKEVGILVLSYFSGRVFCPKQKVYLIASFLFHCTGLIHKKGIGMHRFRKSYNMLFKL